MDEMIHQWGWTAGTSPWVSTISEYIAYLFNLVLNIRDAYISQVWINLFTSSPPLYMDPWPVPWDLSLKSLSSPPSFFASRFCKISNEIALQSLSKIYAKNIKSSSPWNSHIIRLTSVVSSRPASLEHIIKALDVPDQSRDKTQDWVNSQVFLGVLYNLQKRGSPTPL